MQRKCSGSAESRVGPAALATLAVAAGAITAGALAQPAGALFAPLSNVEPIAFHIGAPEAEGAQPGDPELCRWALEDWVRRSGGRLVVVPADEPDALIRIHFVGASAGQYGEMRPFIAGGRRGADVYVRPDTEALGPEIAAAANADPLFRETVVYLTCLHEIGHALGLEHTDDFDDIMYFFGFGGDIRAYFGRYRESFALRDEIRERSGLSARDIERLQRLYRLPGEGG